MHEQRDSHKRRTKITLVEITRDKCRVVEPEINAVWCGQGNKCRAMRDRDKWSVYVDWGHGVFDDDGDDDNDGGRWCMVALWL